MVGLNDTAPDFTAPLATGDVESVTLSDRLDDAPIVLAFFPAAFTSTCTTEMCTFDDRLGAFEALDATVFGVSVDSPYVLNEFRDKYDIDVDIVSDFEKTIIEDYDVRTDFDHHGVNGLAQRSVFVVDETQTITYTWIADHAGLEPDYDAVEAAVKAAVEDAA